MLFGLDAALIPIMKCLVEEEHWVHVASSFRSLVCFSKPHMYPPTCIMYAITALCTAAVYPLEKDRGSVFLSA